MSDNMEGIDALKRQGWTMRFAACEPRLGEAAEMYRNAGFEVLLEPLPANRECKERPGQETNGECRVCFDGFEDRYRIIFTRPMKDGERDGEGLF